MTSVSDEIRKAVWRSVHNAVWDSVTGWKSVRVFVSCSVWNSVYDSVRESVRDSVENSVNQKLQEYDFSK